LTRQLFAKMWFGRKKTQTDPDESNPLSKISDGMIFDLDQTFDIDYLAPVFGHSGQDDSSHDEGSCGCNEWRDNDGVIDKMAAALEAFWLTRLYLSLICFTLLFDVGTDLRAIWEYTDISSDWTAQKWIFLISIISLLLSFRMGILNLYMQHNERSLEYSKGSIIRAYIPFAYLPRVLWLQYNVIRRPRRIDWVPPKNFREKLWWVLSCLKTEFLILVLSPFYPVYLIIAVPALAHRSWCLMAKRRMPPVEAIVLSLIEVMEGIPQMIAQSLAYKYDLLQSDSFWTSMVFSILGCIKAIITYAVNYHRVQHGIWFIHWDKMCAWNNKDMKKLPLAFIGDSTTVEWIWLNDNNLDDNQEWEKFFQLFPKLKELHLISEKPGLRNALKFCTALLRQKIEVLRLNDNNLTDVAANKLADVLRVNKSIVQLNCNKNRITSWGARTLAQSLERNGTLEELYIRSNFIGNKGATEFGRMLRTNSSLLVLNLSNNHIGDDGCKELAECLLDNQKLHDLDLSENEIGTIGLCSLSKMLQKNGHLHLYLYKNKNIPEEGKTNAKLSFKERVFFTEEKNTVMQKELVKRRNSPCLQDVKKKNTNMMIPRGLTIFGSSRLTLLMNPSDDSGRSSRRSRSMKSLGISEIPAACPLSDKDLIELTRNVEEI